MKSCFSIQHLVTHLVGLLAKNRTRWFKNGFIKFFIKRYQVNLHEAQSSNLQDYENFNAFFTRHLKPEARDLAKPSNIVISPIDGTLSEFGQINHDVLIQAKGMQYSLAQLLANDDLFCQRYQGGMFATLYLAPKDYHRVHMPCAGQLVKTCYVPGKLFSVHPRVVAKTPHLFARNERLICHFKSPQGNFALILVGAMVVASIHTTWGGEISPPHRKEIVEKHYHDQTIHLERGQEMGFFDMGSTVILLFEKDALQWDPILTVAQPIQLGNSLATIIKD